MSRYQEQRDPLTGQPADRRNVMIETKEFFRTSEFFVLATLIVGLWITALAVDGFGALEAWPLITFLGMAYIISRGLAKAGTAHPFAGRDPIGLRERMVEMLDSNRHDDPRYQYQAAPPVTAPSAAAYAPAPTQPVPVRPEDASVTVRQVPSVPDSAATPYRPPTGR